VPLFKSADPILNPVALVLDSAGSTSCRRHQLVAGQHDAYATESIPDRNSNSTSAQIAVVDESCSESRQHVLKTGHFSTVEIAGFPKAENRHIGRNPSVHAALTRMNNDFSLRHEPCPPAGVGRPLGCLPISVLTCSSLARLPMQPRHTQEDV
jgi:hypothetical protein